MAFMSESTPGRIIATHYHPIDQFQVFVKGSGRLGSHAVTAGTVHFTRAYTPYGPIVAGAGGIGWISMYGHWDGGAQYLDTCREKLLAVPNRRPWQVSADATFESPHDLSDVAVTPIAGVHDNDGLSATAIMMPPFSSTTIAPPLSGPAFVLVLAGSVTRDQAQHEALAVGCIPVGGSAFDLTAGPGGARVLSLCFPREVNSAQSL